MAYSISGSVARVVLTALQEISGPQYTKILQESGLERYSTALPPEGEAPVISEGEMVRFQQTVYRMLGEDLLRLFRRNFGQASAQALAHGPWGAQIRAQIAGIPADRQMGWLVAQYVALAETMGGRYELTEDATAWYMDAITCLECLDLHGAKAPICATLTAVLKGLGDQILGRRIRVEEIACRAVGAPRCKRVIYK
ncbi:MAG TPA: 4-vinyl reductase [Chloroflexia bacterium]|nr:4-vinyl reductase [Chloroflexia bacterium]